MSTNACGPRHATHLATSLCRVPLANCHGCDRLRGRRDIRTKIEARCFWATTATIEPARRAAELLPVLAERGIDVRYSDNVDEVLSRLTI